jgi:hypothetical protein
MQIIILFWPRMHIMVGQDELFWRSVGKSGRLGGKTEKIGGKKKRGWHKMVKYIQSDENIK